ncbi:MAG: M23 family metallopeptidase [Firmicutes bacterium]|nr:M23 family metallopeptidase [Bacillota bacterium]
MKKLLIRTFVVMVIALILVSGRSCEIKVLSSISSEIINFMEADLTISDIETIGTGIISSITDLPESVSTMHERIVTESKYEYPVDEDFKEESTTVHAAAGGVVKEIGNNNDIGKYVILRHGNDAETIYGNLKEVYCSLNQNVRQGEIIGLYEKNPEKNFVYTLNYFD